jgi:NTP pyrophosphatase (non-canonical NTP hydrolase)
MPVDTDTYVAALRQAVAAFVEEREWQPFHTPKNLSMSISIEAAELMEQFQWLTPDESRAATSNAAQGAAIAGELADVMIYCLSLANVLDLDISSAVTDKLSNNEIRYPATEFRGRFRRPERYRETGNAR